MPERATTAGATLRLLQWAGSTTFATLPAPVAARAARVLADDLAAMTAAHAEPEVVRFHRALLDRPGLPEATLFRGGRARVDRTLAAVGNALAADWLELDEGYRKASCHAGLYVLPALLAEAEAGDLTLGDVLRNLVLGYEIVTRVARAFPLPEHPAHPHARYASIGAATAVALARGLPPERALDALTAAATFSNAGPHVHAIDGALIRNAWPAAGAWSGMMSVLLADCGITGASHGLFDVFASVWGGEARPQELVAGLGESWAILDGYSKMHACCQYAHSTVEAVLGARAATPTPRPWQDIEEVRIATHALARPMINDRPATTLAGKFSLPHIAAAVWVHGHAGAPAFATESLTDPRIASLRSKVKVEALTPELAPPNDRPARVTVRFTDGSTLAGECLSAPGGPDRPFPDEIVMEKVRALATPVYPRLPAIARSWMAPSSAQLAQPWEAVVESFCKAQ